jgi:hypothetical protein
MVWQVTLSKKVGKQYRELQHSGRKRPSIIDVVDALFIELEALGLERANWPNYSKLAKDVYHCHLQKKGRPTYVACWRTFNKEIKQIEVHYVGTREGAPY